jgi:excisionase family DNA binding protein
MRNAEIQKQILGLKEMIVSSESLHDEIMDFNSACQFLKLSPSYLYKLTCKRVIPHFKPSGKKLFFSKLDLTEWIKTGRKLTIGEMEKKSKEYVESKRKNSL